MFLRNMPFAKKHNRKGLKKMQTNNTKAMNRLVKAIKALIKPTEVKPKISKGWWGENHKLNWHVYIIHCKLRKHAHAHIAKGLRLSQTKSKVSA